MTAKTSVSFETYYFLELLEKIRKDGKKQYQPADYDYLVRFLDYLKDDNDAHVSIEKIARAQSTSDLAIFFSDILEHIHRVSPEESMERLPSRVDDFLEIFQVFLNNEEWRQLLESELFATAESGTEASASEAEAVDFTEFCQRMIDEVLLNDVANLSDDIRENYLQVAHTLLQQPELANQIEMTVDHPDVMGLYEATYALSQIPAVEPNQFDMEGFRRQIVDWSQKFKNIYLDMPLEINELVLAETPAETTEASSEPVTESPEEVGAEEEMVSAEAVTATEAASTEEPFENLFEEADKEFAEAEEDEAAYLENAQELDELVESISKRPARPTAQITDDEETLERRRMLRDYVISEIETYAEEFTDAAAALAENPHNADMSLQLKDALKALKDIGKIHNYPAVEAAADSLLNLYSQLQLRETSFPTSENDTIQALFDNLKHYVDALIEGEYQAVGQQIEEQLTGLNSRLLEETQVSNVYSAETVSNAFQDVVSRVARQLQHYLQQPESPETLVATFDNLAYWNTLLMPESAQKAVNELAELMKSERCADLDAADRQRLSEILVKWETQYTTASEEEWTEMGNTIDEIVTRVEGVVDVHHAGAAFNDVLQRQIHALRRQLETAEAATSILPSFAAFLSALRENSQLAGRVDLANLAVELRSTLSALDSDTLASPALSAAVETVLESLEQQVIIEGEEVDFEALNDLFKSTVQPTEITETEESAEEAATEIETESQPAPDAEFESESVEEAESDGVDSDEISEEELFQELQGVDTSAEEPLYVLPDEEEGELFDELTSEMAEAGESATSETEITEEAPEPETAYSTADAESETEPEPELPSESEVATDAGETVSEFTVDTFAALKTMEEIVDALAASPAEPELWQKLSAEADTLSRLANEAVQTEVCEIADSISEIALKAKAGAIVVDDALLTAIQRALNGIDEIVTEQNDSSETVLDELSAAVRPVEPETVAQPPASDDEAEYVVLKEKDAELLEIFKSEVSGSFDQIERNLTNLEKFTFDKEAVQHIERQIHEIRAAAKMLGLTEIGQISDLFEEMFEKYAQKQIDDVQQVLPLSRKAIHVIRQLTNEHKVEKSSYDEVIGQLQKLLSTPSIETSQPMYIAPQQQDISREFVEEVKESAVADEPVEEAPAEEPAEQEEEPAETPATVAPQVLEMYLHEAREQLDDINYLLIKLEKEPGNEELQHHLMRCMHTLKGSSGMVHARGIEKMAHRCEDILELHLQQRKPLTPPLFDILFRVIDEIQMSVQSLEDEGKEHFLRYSEIMAQLNQYYSELSGKTVDVVEQVEAAQPAAEKEASAAQPKPEPTAEMPPKKDTYLRLNINKMNQLLNLAAESVIGNTQFKNQLDGLKRYAHTLNANLSTLRETEDFLNNIIREERKVLENIVELNPETAEPLRKQVDALLRVMKNVKTLQDELSTVTQSLRENAKSYDEHLQKLSKLSNQLLEEILQARLVPIDMLFQRFHRPIRDLAHQLKKQIRLSMSGEQTELDRTLIDDLYEPLLHLIRNAIDHGLETAEERLAAGKPAEGLLQIKAIRDRNQVIIEVKDDGRGIDLEKIKAKAIQKGYITEKDARSMSEQELYEFLFYPGFTTASETTLVSGRGVGLDAVKSQIEKAKGDIRMHTELGKGTTFSIRVPISLSVIQSMLVDVSGHVYSIPLLQVEETLNIKGQDLIRENNHYYIRYRERKIPVILLAELLKVNQQSEFTVSPVADYPLIMIQDEGQRMGVLVDRIIRREEILIKSLGPGLRRLKYISGGSIMADGQVVLVLDIHQIIQDVLKTTTEKASAEKEIPIIEEPETATEAAPPVQQSRIKHVSGRKPVALIVDDSLSIRKYISELLNQQGYVTDTARNGYEALELLKRQEFDILITDLEMPKLSGYELIETLRYEKRYNHLPMTGRSGDSFKQLTKELGADAFIAKPFKDRELLEQLNNYIVLDQ